MRPGPQWSGQTSFRPMHLKEAFWVRIHCHRTRDKTSLTNHVWQVWLKPEVAGDYATAMFDRRFLRDYANQDFAKQASFWSSPSTERYSVWLSTHQQAIVHLGLRADIGVFSDLNTRQMPAMGTKQSEWNCCSMLYLLFGERRNLGHRFWFVICFGTMVISRARWQFSHR